MSTLIQSARKLHVFAEQEHRRMRRASSERRKQDAEAFCDRMIGEGRLTFAMKQQTAMPLLLSLDDSNPAWRFSEGGTTRVLTAYELKKAQIAKGPVIVQFGERILPGSTAQTEVNKVEKFAEKFSDNLKIHGFDAKRTIALAKKMADRDTNFRAEQLIGADAARMLG